MMFRSIIKFLHCTGCFLRFLFWCLLLIVCLVLLSASAFFWYLLLFFALIFGIPALVLYILAKRTR